MSIKAKFTVLRDNFSLNIDVILPLQSITALLGPSGCGKTTILRAIAGLEKHPNAFLKIGDHIWQNNEIFIPTHKRLLGYVFQEPGLFPHLNVRHNIEYGIKRSNIIHKRISLDHVIDLLGIEHLLERKPLNLSGGEKQRVAIARAVALDPMILLMDEPLASLDIARKNEVLPYIKSLQKDLDIPIIYVSHSPDEVARLADQVVLMDNGKITSISSVYDAFTNLNLPLAHNTNAETIIETTIAKHDDDYSLTLLKMSGGFLTISRKDMPLNSKVRVRIAARDVSITTEHQSNTSILNIFECSVDKLKTEGLSHVTVKLNLNGTPLLSRITRKSADQLKLTENKKVFAQIKSVALLD